MKIFGLKIKTGFAKPVGPGFTTSIMPKSSPSAERTEWYKSDVKRAARYEQIKKICGRNWFSSLDCEYGFD